jgi:hypothetical protein
MGRDGQEQVRWHVPTGALPPVTPKSEIIDADGTIWVVHRMERERAGSCICYVTKHDSVR